MTVSLRQRQKGDKISLYLDYYKDGKREYEYLKLYLTPVPQKGRLSAQQKEQNRRNIELAESIRSKRHLEIQNGIYGFYDKQKLETSFLKYFEVLADRRNESMGNQGNWKSALRHLQEFAQGDIAFNKITKEWLERFKEHLKSTTKVKSSKRLSPNTQFSYYAKVVASLKQAQKVGLRKLYIIESKSPA